MNLEEAKLSIGKEVVLLKETKPYFGRIIHDDDFTEAIELKKNLIIERFYEDEGFFSVSGYALRANHFSLKQEDTLINEIPAVSKNNEQEMQFKVGDKVRLRPETKPYTYLPLDSSSQEELTSTLDESITYKITEVYQDTDVWIERENNKGFTPINIKHLKHANESTAFEDYQDELYQRVSDSVTALESDMKSELEKLECENIIELRLSIFNGNTSRTLEEMQAIEAWLLGESK